MVKENRMKIIDDFLREKTYPWLRMISLYGNKISSIHLEGLKNKILKLAIYELILFTIL